MDFLNKVSPDGWVGFAGTIIGILGAYMIMKYQLTKEIDSNIKSSVETQLELNNLNYYEDIINLLHKIGLGIHALSNNNFDDDKNFYFNLKQLQNILLKTKFEGNSRIFKNIGIMDMLFTRVKVWINKPYSKYEKIPKDINNSIMKFDELNAENIEIFNNLKNKLKDNNLI